MFNRKKYIYNKLKKIGLEDSIINDLYNEKLTKEEIDIIASSNYPYEMCRLLVVKKFRELKINKNQIINFINDSEEQYQAFYASMVAINNDVLDSPRILSIIYNITRSKKPEYAKTAYKVGIDKDILDSKYSNIATAMASQGTKIEKIYDLVYSDSKNNYKTKSRKKLKR